MSKNLWFLFLLFILHLMQSLQSPHHWFPSSTILAIFIVYTTQLFIHFSDLFELKTLSHLNLFGFLNTAALDRFSDSRPDIHINKHVNSPIARPIASTTYEGRLWEQYVGFIIWKNTLGFSRKKNWNLPVEDINGNFQGGQSESSWNPRGYVKLWVKNEDFQGVIIKLTGNSGGPTSKKLLPSTGGYNFFQEKAIGSRMDRLMR